MTEEVRPEILIMMASSASLRKIQGMHTIKFYMREHLAMKTHPMKATGIQSSKMMTMKNGESYICSYSISIIETIYNV